MNALRYSNPHIHTTKPKKKCVVVLISIRNLILNEWKKNYRRTTGQFIYYNKY